jgi:TPR repeat protein
LTQAPSHFQEARSALERGDTATAIRLMKPLADQGDQNAQAMMGAAHERLKPPDLPGSVRWFRLAAHQGHSTAQYYVGLFCETGTRGVPRDRVEAYKWLTLSVRRGNIYAPRDLSRIEKQMTADELTEGKKRVSEWKPSSPASPVSVWSSGAEKWPVPHGSSQSLINAYGARRNDRGPIPTPAELKAMEAGIP